MECALILSTVTSGLNICTDIWILALPVKTLIHINRPKHEKIALMAIFGVGMFATITSIIRLHTIYTYTLAKDPFQESILVNLWSVIETNTAIVCASVPALKPLFTPAQLRAARENASGSGSSAPKRSDYHYHSQERSGYITSTKSVDVSHSDNSYNMGLINSVSTARITSGEKVAPPKLGGGDDSTENIVSHHQENVGHAR
jgi:hypothetical protein